MHFKGIRRAYQFQCAPLFMRQARNHATHFKCQEKRLQQQPKPDLRDLRFSWYPWQKSTVIHLTPHVPGARSNEQLAQTVQAFLSKHRKDFWLSCMGVEKMWWWWAGHSGTCSSEMKTNLFFISVLFMHKKTKKTCSHQLQKSRGFQILMSESCSQHKNIAHPTVHIDMKLVLDYVLWHMSQSMKGQHFWTLFNFVHSISVQNKKNTSVLLVLLKIFQCFSNNTLINDFWLSCSYFSPWSENK